MDQPIDEQNKWMTYPYYNLYMGRLLIVLSLLYSYANIVIYVFNWTVIQNSLQIAIVYLSHEVITSNPVFIHDRQSNCQVRVNTWNGKFKSLMPFRKASLFLALNKNKEK